MADTYSINGWEKYQHYKDRNPPWIKLHAATLTSPTWLKGTDRTRMLQTASVLLAARYDNAIPLDMEILRPVAGLKCTDAEFNEALAYLEQSDFITIAHGKQRASRPQAKRSPSRGEDIDQGEKTPVVPKAGKCRLADDWKPEEQTMALGKTLGLTDAEISTELSPGGAFFDHFQGPECKEPERPGWDRSARAWLRRGSAAIIGRRPRAAAAVLSPTLVVHDEEGQWRARVLSWMQSPKHPDERYWNTAWGPPPHHLDTHVPRKILDETGACNELPPRLARTKPTVAA